MDLTCLVHVLFIFDMIASKQCQMIMAVFSSIYFRQNLEITDFYSDLSSIRQAHFPEK